MRLEQFLWVFENPTGTNSQIAGFNRNRSISIEETSKGWMFFIVSDTKFFMKPECRLIRILSLRIHTNGKYLCYLEKISLVQWILVITNSKGGAGFCLIEQRLEKGRKNKEVKFFSILYIFLIVPLLSRRFPVANRFKILL